MLFAVLGFTALCVLIYSCILGKKHPHLARMAIRNVKLHKKSALLTMLGTMIGTALLTSSLLFQHSMDESVKRSVEEQVGQIVSDLPASRQPLLHTPYWTEEEIQRAGQDRDKQISEEIKGSLPTAAIQTVVQTQNEQGEPLLLSPQTYVQGFDFDEAAKLQPNLTQLLPSALSDSEIILSEPLAHTLEAQVGSKVIVADAGGSQHAFTVKSIVKQTGLTGYKGTEKARSTAIVNLRIAQNLSGIPEQTYTNLLCFSNAPISLEQFGYVSPFNNQNWSEVPVHFLVMNELKTSTKLLPIFTIASLNAMLIGIALVINMFKMLAEERRQEMGILRAMGLQRKDLSRLFQLEGVYYAAGSSILGAAAGIGLSWVLVWKLSSFLSTMLEKVDGLFITYHFQVDVQSLLTGCAAGFLLVMLCVKAVAYKARKVTIVEAIQSGGGQSGIHVNSKGSVFKQVSRLLILLLTISLILISTTSAYQEWASDSDLQPIIHFALGFVVLLGMVFTVLVFYMPITRFCMSMIRPFPKLSAVLKMAFRYPAVHKMRSGLLLFMFALILYLTAFSGVFSSTFSHFFGDHNPRDITGGYDLIVQKAKSMSSEELDRLLSSRLPTGTMETAASVLQTEYKGDLEGILNGIDERFAQTTTLKLLERESKFASDRAVWEEAANNPDVMIISERTLLPDHSPKVGEMYKFEVNGHPIQKKIIGIAKFEGNSETFKTALGAWVSRSVLLHSNLELKSVSSSLVFTAAPGSDIQQAAKALEKALSPYNIFPVINPMQTLEMNSGFIKIFFSVFEQFSALATFIGILGLFVVMLRVIRERRQQIGMMRAVGISKRIIFCSILVEGVFLGGAGILIGMCMGTWTGHQIIYSLLEHNRNEVQILFPYLKLGLYLAGTIVCTLFASLIPAKQSLKLPPAEATRYTS